MFGSLFPSIKLTHIQENQPIHLSKKIATHPQNTPQAIPRFASYERNPGL